MVLKAIVMPKALPALTSAARVVASISATSSALTSTSPLTVNTLRSTIADAPPRTRLVAMTPPAASDVPCPVKLLPPDEVAVTSASARITACSMACTFSELAVSSTPTTDASTLDRTSFNTTAAAMPTDGDVVTFKPCGKKSLTAIGFHQPRSVYGIAVPSVKVGAARLVIAVVGPIHS